MYAIKEDTLAKVFKTARISTKSAVKVCRRINRMQFSKAVALINAVHDKKANMDGKYYTNVVKSVKEALHELEMNAKQKNIDPNDKILFISAHKGPTLARSRRKRGFGIYLKSTHIQAFLKESSSKKEKPEQSSIERGKDDKKQNEAKKESKKDVKKTETSVSKND